MDKNEAHILLKMKLHLYNYPMAKVSLGRKYDNGNARWNDFKKVCLAILVHLTWGAPNTALNWCAFSVQTMPISQTHGKKVPYLLAFTGF